MLTKWCCVVAVPQFGMEMYARFAHKVLWHDFEPGWALHKSHHEPRTGPFEVSKQPSAARPPTPLHAHLAAPYARPPSQLAGLPELA